MTIQIELDEPYQIMYEQLVDENDQESVDEDIKKLVQNALHESSQNKGEGME
jgi:hypothetical protein